MASAGRTDLPAVSGWHGRRFASQEEIEQHDGIFGIKADAWSAILLEKNEEYLEDEYSRPDAALTVISREQALRLV